MGQRPNVAPPVTMMAGVVLTRSAEDLEHQPPATEAIDRSRSHSSDLQLGLDDPESTILDPLYQTSESSEGVCNHRR